MAADTDAVDEAALREYLAAALDEPAPEPFAVEPLTGGNANETLALTWGDRELVVRRPPADETAPGILHDLLREYEVLDALAGTWVPAPAVVLACEDESVLGDVFYVMERVEGDVLEDVPDRFDAVAHRRRIGAATVDTLAKIHHLDVERVGLEEFGDPADYAARQVEVLTDQLEWASERTAAVRELPVLREVGNRLAASPPETRHGALVHGDYKPDNLAFAPGTPPRVEAVLDWEMSTLGDPLADLGWLLSYWTEARDPSPLTDDLRERYADHDYYPMLEVFVEDYSTFMREEGYHDRRELIERYQKQTGYEYTDDRFYRALGVYKLAVLCEGFFRAFLEDAPGAKPSYPLMELAVPALARQARQVLDGEVPL